MINSYLKLAWRNLLKNRVFSAIVISGLALGYAACMLIYLHVTDELSYDKHFENSDRIHRVVKDFINDDGSALPDATTPPALAPAILHEIPEIEAVTRIFPSWGAKYLVRNGDKVFYEEGRLMADTSILRVFSFEFLEGNRSTALAKPENVVVTKSLARKYFGSESPIGKTLQIGLGENSLMVVTAVIKDLPANSHFHFDFLLPEPTRASDWNAQWGWYNWYTYIKLKPGASIADVEAKIIALFKKNNPESKTRYYTQALSDIHLNSRLKWELEPNGDKTFVNIFIIVGIFIILIAAINYINLAISQAFSRSKEVGVRKVSGAYTEKLVHQFLTESTLTSLVAMIFAAAVLEIMIPVVNDQFGKALPTMTGQPLSFIFGSVTAALLIGIVSGLYPSFYLSAFKPVQVLKGVLQPGNQNLWLRKGLVVMQFAISIALISGTIVVVRQVDYLRSKDLGFNKDQVVVIENVANLNRPAMRAMKEAFRQIHNVEHVGGSNGVLGTLNWTTSMAAKGSTTSSLVNTTAIDYGYIDAMDLHIIQGRNFSAEIPSDTLYSVIVNETALRDLGIAGDPIGVQITDNPGQDTLQYLNIVGVVKDFHFANLRNEIKPYMFYLGENRSSNYVVKMAAGDVTSTINAMREAWQSIAPDKPFEYFFLDESFQAQYRGEENFKTVFSVLATMSVYIACSGLFAIATFFIRRRTKEIGIRKVMGATITQITWLVSSEFLAIVITANIIAWPVAYYFMDAWLNAFAYRVDMGWMSFLVAGGVALLIAVIVVGYQSIRSAIANPVRSLRNE